jgi:hypothetical protein
MTEEGMEKDCSKPQLLRMRRNRVLAYPKPMGGIGTLIENWIDLVMG